MVERFIENRVLVLRRSWDKPIGAKSVPKTKGAASAVPQCGKYGSAGEHSGPRPPQADTGPAIHIVRS